MAAEGHRKDIDGLRAVAILPVLFYHANIWPFAGGYVGVDVFFVISGYLITGLILRAQAGTGFSLRDFYDRRIRRILPALFAVLAVASIAALLILLPDELQSYGNSLIASVLFGANLLYWQRDAAYFAADANQNPLLHIWSLAVEEQFYLFWPLLLVALARWRRLLPWLIALMALASLALFLAYLRINPNVSFYLLPHRAWQLLVGAFLAAGAISPPRNAVARHCAALAGIALIGVAVLLPRWVLSYHALGALGAALGAAAILFAAEGGPNIVSRALATRLPVFIGNISYSLYLWHWPMLVFARLALSRELSHIEAGAVLLAAVAVSALSWKYIEQPFRRRRVLWRGWPLSFAGAAAGGTVLLLAAAVLLFAQGFPARVPVDARAVAAAAAAPLPGRWCEVSDGGVAACLHGDPAFKAEAILWGDSHARAIAPGLENFARARHLRLRQLTRSACAPLPAVEIASPTGGFYGRCGAFNREVLAFILAAKNVRLVILQARWDVYPARAGKANLADTLSRLVRTLTARGTAVLIIGDVPQFPDVPSHCYARQRMFGRDPSACLVLSDPAAYRRIVATEALLAAVTAGQPAARTYFPRDALCERARCHAFFAGQVLYRDAHHLSPFGARLVGHALDAALQNWPR